jgi:hypothetical protein
LSDPHEFRAIAIDGLGYSRILEQRIKFSGNGDFHINQRVIGRGATGGRARSADARAGASALVLNCYFQLGKILAIVFGGGSNSSGVRGGRQILRAVLRAGAGGVCDQDAVVGIPTNFDYSDGQEQE